MSDKEYKKETINKSKVREALSDDVHILTNIQKTGTWGDYDAFSDFEYKDYFNYIGRIKSERTSSNNPKLRMDYDLDVEFKNNNCRKQIINGCVYAMTVTADVNGKQKDILLKIGETKGPFDVIPKDLKVEAPDWLKAYSGSGRLGSYNAGTPQNRENGTCSTTNYSVLNNIVNYYEECPEVADVKLWAYTIDYSPYLKTMIKVVDKDIYLGSLVNSFHKDAEGIFHDHWKRQFGDRKPILEIQR